MKSPPLSKLHQNIRGGFPLQERFKYPLTALKFHFSIPKVFQVRKRKHVIKGGGFGKTQTYVGQWLGQKGWAGHCVELESPVTRIWAPAQGLLMFSGYQAHITEYWIASMIVLQALRRLSAESYAYLLRSKPQWAEKDLCPDRVHIVCFWKQPYGHKLELFHWFQWDLLLRKHV